MIDSASIPLSLYVHLPWCVRKCPYCDFNSHENPTADHDAYVDALLDDLRAELELAEARPLHSVFIGGGTPSLFPAAAIQRLIDGIKSNIALKPQAELTLEANPGAADAARFSGYLAAGVNRLSIGVQSFDDAALARLGRIHNSAEAYQAIATARDVGFDNINIDIMYALPGHNLAASLDDLEAALSLEPEHLSWYQLTIEEGTAFKQRPPPGLPTHDEQAEVSQRGLSLIEGAGLQRYEVSAFAREGRRSAHNLNYWLFGDYIGIGAGAHGKRSATDSVVRKQKRRNPQSYLRDPLQCEQRSRVAPEDLSVEFALNALRLRDGFSIELFVQRTGLARDQLLDRLSEPLTNGWIYLENEVLRPSPLGFEFLNDLQLYFMN